MRSVPERLEFTRVLGNVASECASEPGRAEVLRLEPAEDSHGSLRLQKETAQAEMLVGLGLVPPVEHCLELGECLRLLDGGAICLEPGQLRDTGLAAESFFRFRKAAEAAETPEPLLAACTSRLPVLDELSGHLLAITTPEGDISPGASPDLLKLVNRENRLRRGLSRRVASIAARLSLAGVLRDSPPSIRNGRFVLPVASGKRGAVTGIIHDRSESGSTLFIEPSELVEDGNALQEANMEIQIERRRILREATSLVRKEKKTLARGLKAAVEIDAIFARARYRIRECTFFPGEGQMRLLGLRHPLIDRETVVRSDFILPDEWKVLVVSGPNAGGKSVLLKAVGLASMMSRSGLGGCVEPGSTMPFFTRVLVSIGDNQSIAEHLSTYSARLSEQKQMLDMGDRSTLAIIDEPAAGTDPSTGAALAASVLSRLASLGTRVLVSTHMGQLKKMAYDTPGFFNGSMVFNRETLTPSYSFISGVPGASFTLEVARAAGFQKSVLEKARILAGDSFKLDNLVISLAEMNELGARETEALKAQRLQEAKSAEARRVQHEEALSEMELLRERLIHEHDNRLREISSRADSLLALMSRKDGSPGESADARREIRKLVEEQRGKRHGFPSAPESHPGSETPKLSPGDWVDIQGWNQPGSIESVDGASARVRSGSYLLTRPLSSLARREPPGVCRASVPEWEPVQGSPEINLLGKTVEEAIAELDQRLDSAIVCGLFRLRIVHGKGVLMTGVTRWLRNDRRLKSLAQASPAEGGTGASIAVLKDGG